MTGVQSWSVTAANNVNANTGVNWDEGMAPGAVNNSARQVLADVRTMANDLIWFQYGKGDGPAPHAYASATSTTVSGADVTAVYHAGRRVKAFGSSTGTIYGSVASSSFSTNTTVNYTWDSGSLANEALTIYLSQVPVTGMPINIASVSGISTALPSRQVLTSGTSYTTGTQSGQRARQLRIRMVGGGGGGQACNVAALGGNGGAGGDTSFNNVVAKGGSGGTSFTAPSGGTGGTGLASLRIAGGSGVGGSAYNPPNPAQTQIGSPAGAASPFGGAGGGSVRNGGNAASPNSGSGGGGGNYADTVAGGQVQAVGGSGAAGEYVEIIINNPSATYSYVVGAAGTAGTGTYPGGSGGAGIIIVDEFY